MAADDSGKTDYFTPKREILKIDDMPKWTASEAYHEYTGFVLAMNQAVKGKKVSDFGDTSELVTGLCSMLDSMDGWINEYPPIEQPQRFGNKAFRQWFERLKLEADKLLQDLLPEQYHTSIMELSVYLVESVGNSTRIDYGTGHEMSFAMFLCCLFKIGALEKSDSAAVIMKVFGKYLILMRKLQLTYRMEPAGSHGVWSLDDYQFLPFIWGSSQLVAHPRIEPRSFPNEDIADSYANDYLFLACIKFINEVKTGPFPEHSNQLWNISGVPTWTKVNGGLIKMYKAEVLAKFPVIQHVLFGSLLPIEKQDPSKQGAKPLLAL